MIQVIWAWTILLFTRSIIPPTITAQPADQTVLAGMTATFTVAATGSLLSYQWQDKERT